MEHNIERRKANRNERPSGWIEVVCGPMFSGKTEELIGRIKRCVYARKKVVLFKPQIDTRYSAVEVVSHSNVSLRAFPVSKPQEILEKMLLPENAAVEVVGVDEIQFFNETIVDVIQELANMGKRVICAGLDLDYQAQPFEPMPKILAIAEYVTKKSSICMVCGDPATRSYRISNEHSTVVLGAEDSYEARCRPCHAEKRASVPHQINFLQTGLQ